MDKRKMIILTGPTAVGKTELSIALAKKYNGAIISADSMQIYRHMDIGTAKITPSEMQGVAHYLIDELEPEEEFHVVQFQKMAKAAMDKIYAEGKLPIVVGGTGFYIQALLYDIDFDQADEMAAFREKMLAFAKENGAEKLHEKLRKVDPVSADTIHPNNIKRVIRALEYFEETGQPISRHNEEQRKKQSPYDFRYFVLTDDRQRLYQRIEQRVDQMMQQGLLEEVKQLKQRGCTKEMISMQGIGYKELLAFLDGTCSLEEAVYVLKRDTRHFAKRQLTWFRREPDVIWLDKQKYKSNQELMTEIADHLWKNEKE